MQGLSAEVYDTGRKFLRFRQFRATLPDSGSLHPCLFGVLAAVSVAAWFDDVDCRSGLIATPILRCWKLMC